LIFFFFLPLVFFFLPFKIEKRDGERNTERESQRERSRGDPMNSKDPSSSGRPE
jgi:hypothetical protein